MRLGELRRHYAMMWTEFQKIAPQAQSSFASLIKQNDFYEVEVVPSIPERIFTSKDHVPGTMMMSKVRYENSPMYNGDPVQKDTRKGSTNARILARLARSLWSKKHESKKMNRVPSVLPALCIPANSSAVTTLKSILRRKPVLSPLHNSLSIVYNVKVSECGYAVQKYRGMFQH